MANEARLYFKVGNHIVSALKSDCEKQIIDCSQVRVLVWTTKEPYYKFEYNDLAQYIAENEDIYRFKGFNSPEPLIDKEIVAALKKRASLEEKETHLYQVNYGIDSEARHEAVLCSLEATRRILQRRMDYSYRVSKAKKKSSKGKNIEGDLVPAKY